MYSISISNRFFVNSSKDVFLLPTVGVITTLTNMAIIQAVTAGPITINHNIATRNNNRGSNLFSDYMLEKDGLDFSNGISLDDLIQLRFKCDSSI